MRQRCHQNKSRFIEQVLRVVVALRARVDLLLFLYFFMPACLCVYLTKTLPCAHDEEEEEAKKTPLRIYIVVFLRGALLGAERIYIPSLEPANKCIYSYIYLINEQNKYELHVCTMAVIIQMGRAVYY